jgi:hypothetical protein
MSGMSAKKPHYSGLSMGKENMWGEILNTGKQGSTP